MGKDNNYSKKQLMRFVLLFLVLSQCPVLFAQKRKKNKQPFPYSYTVTSERYQFHQLIEIQISKGNNDTIVISGNADKTGLKGNVYLNRYRPEEQLTTFDSCFQLKIDSKNLKSTTVTLDFEDFDNYEENSLTIDLTVIPNSFTIDLEGKTAFDPETGYIYIHSKNELSQTEIDKIIRCIGSRKEGQSCYDSSKIFLLFAI